jgi:N-acetylmuramoyl-L-alanine amidase
VEPGSAPAQGVVYHRLFGTLQGSDEFLSTLEAGGRNGLLDFGVDHESGEIWMWNDPLGEPRPERGVSANRAPWAQGAVVDPSPDAQAFLDDNGGDLDVVNRDQVSIAISGQAEDPISDVCVEAVAWLSAYCAGLGQIGADDYPNVPGKAYGFVRWHNEFDASRDCPGPVVVDATPEIIARTREILRRCEAGG